MRFPIFASCLPLLAGLFVITLPVLNISSSAAAIAAQAAVEDEARSLRITPVDHILWPDGAPGALGEAPKDQPKVTVYRPLKVTGLAPAILICPGGGYGGLAMDHEGTQIAAWMNRLGLVACILDYRHRGKGYGHPAPMLDAQRGIRWIRSNAESLGVDSSKIGIIGFSAGGHLASTVSTHFDLGDAKANDPIDKFSCRPDFSILCYGVLQFGTSATHLGSQRNLLGNDADPKLIESLSNDKQVTANTPPTFLWHTHEDSVVPPQNSAAYYLALKQNNVDAELHIFQKGRHGVGLAKGISGTQAWPMLCEEFLERHRMLGKTPDEIPGEITAAEK